MNKSRLFLPLLAFALLMGGCDNYAPVAPEGVDGPTTLFATFPPASVAMIGGNTLNLNPQCGNGGSTNDANVMRATGGGCLPVAGYTALNGFSFTPLSPGAVTAGSLAAFDIAVVNMATYTLQCDANNLPAAAKAEIIGFAGAGKKVLIYDSECYFGVGGAGVDYSWLPYPFTTANPGALGAQGTLTIVEENTLSTNASGPYFIDAGILGTQTDAVGDMNVMTTQDPAWCVDMAGTNDLGVTGAVHTYANYPTGTDFGLFIYNGLDMDYLYYGPTGPTGTQELLKVWVNELLQPVDPSGLPCRIPVVNIRLDPADATNNVGEDHTLTATVADLLSAPQSNVLVSFEVVAGPNGGDAGTGTTDANGETTFTYTGDGGVGVDELEACFTDAQGVVKCSAVVTKTWVNVPPTCGPVTVDQYLLLAGDAVTASGSFTDVGDPGDHTAVWHWGDFTTSPGTVDQVAHTVGPDSHTYTETGSFILELEVTDAAGDVCGSRYGRVRVYDPDAGFVTGGGWINSPAGAYRPDGSIEGKATFGFVAKYRKGATVPTGNIEFQLHDADLNFHSQDLLWLVVADNATRFWLRGEGTINGEMSPGGVPYEFMIYAEEGDPDTASLWIWGTDEGGGVYILYRSGLEPLDGGNIVIHTKGK